MSRAHRQRLRRLSTAMRFAHHLSQHLSRMNPVPASHPEIAKLAARMLQGVPLGVRVSLRDDAKASIWNGLGARK